jgi:cytidylate kinase
MPKSKKMTDQRRAVVAIDGPVASGKSSVGRAAAAELGLRFLDTGIMYRAVTWLALHRGVAVLDSEAVGALAGDCKITLGNDRQWSAHASTDWDPSVASDIVIDGHAPGPGLWSAEVDGNVSAVSAVPRVRRELVRWQRAIGDGGGIIMAGRDIGSVVLPDADVKLYIDASPEERARRRYAQQVQTSPETEYEQVLADTRRRDALDTQRADSPLVVATGAIVIATDELDREQAVATVVEKIRAVAAAAGTCG